MDFSDTQGYAGAVAYLSPGFLIMFGRSRFLTGRMTSVASSVFEYLMVSSIYFAAALPVVDVMTKDSGWVKFTYFFGAPVLIGLFIGFVSQKQLLRKVFGWVSLNPVHHCPTAWDYAFGDRTNYTWVVVNLFSGGKYYGVFGPNSLASSDLNRRDIYIENIHDRDFKPIETDGRSRGVWISESDIRSIEMIRDQH